MGRARTGKAATLVVVSIEGTAELPIFLAALAASGIALGGCLAMWEEGFSITDLSPSG